MCFFLCNVLEFFKSCVGLVFGIWYLVFGGIYFLSSDKIYCKVVEKTSKRSTYTILFMHFHVYHTTFAIKYGH